MAAQHVTVQVSFVRENGEFLVEYKDRGWEFIPKPRENVKVGSFIEMIWDPSQFKLDRLGASD